MERLLLLPILGLVACTSEVAESTPSGVPSWSVTVSEMGPWTATLSRNGAEADSFFFPRSRGDYRRSTFTGDIPVERVGAFDVVTFPEGVDRLDFDIVPYTRSIPETYTPVLDFGGSEAAGYGVFTGLFALSVLPEGAAPDSLEDPDYSGMLSLEAPLTLSGEGAAVWEGEAQALPLTIDSSDDGYAYVGAADIVESESFAGVIDPTLPDWLADRLEPELREGAAALTRRYGASPSDTPNLFLTYQGPKQQGLSLTGGALPGPTLALQLAGSALAEPNDQVSEYLRWFLLHELAHTFQTEIGFIPAGTTGADWVVEGSANSAAHIIAQELDGGGSLARRTEEAIAACAGALEGRRLEDVLADGSGTYECGDLVMRATANAAGIDVFELQRRLSGEREPGWAGVRTALTDADSEALARMDRLFDGPVTDAAGTLGEFDM